MALYQGSIPLNLLSFDPLRMGGDAIETHAWRHCGGSRAARELGKLQH